jgi:hypothetical protein
MESKGLFSRLAPVTLDEQAFTNEAFPRPVGSEEQLKVIRLLAISLITGGFAFAAGSPAEASDPESEAMLAKYLSATQEQKSAMRGATMTVDINAEVPKLKRRGKLQALRSISKLGKITYHALEFIGDKSIKTEVIARYLTAETSQADNGPDISLTSANYKFKGKGRQDYEGRQVYVFQVTPKKKQVGLFKGEIWIDTQTYMPVRESGRFVKSPSIIIKGMEFVRTYEVKDGVAVEKHLESKVETRIFGPVTMTIDFTNFSKDSSADVAISSGNSVQ